MLRGTQQNHKSKIKNHKLAVRDQAGFPLLGDHARTLLRM
jgi:hypothetical protein